MKTSKKRAKINQETSKLALKGIKLETVASVFAQNELQR